jgi:glycosyltransferase involved in cell wall biosynthesis
MTAPLSVIILTFNEEGNLGAALDSVIGWAAEVFVVDSFSTDRTVDIALAYEGKGVHVVQHRFENYSAQWNWALTSLPLSHPWTLKLDADERATDAFRAEVSERITSEKTEETAFIVHWRWIFMGSFLRRGGLYPNGNIRVWRTGQGYFEKREVNEHLVINGKVGVIGNPIEHHTYKDLARWLDRHNRYSTMEARALLQGNVVGETKPRFFGRPDERRMWLRQVYYRVPFRHFIYFCYRYLFRMGFLDGKAGFRFAFLHAVFFYWIDLKIDDYRRTGVMPEVLWPSRGQPHPVVAASELQRQVDVSAGVASAPS